ncbi:SurA N-terminal domain-containing protein [Streptomyces sp. H27-H5]|uniref:SurA N-terminal domain-containing protein n=1 Tax=Streptomyces sp. H27-H5 TaxID=2996460 RepID=UPI00226EA3FF|nr:SurA N-terminal domain-containing protein [Streptomyces sp. H27-H5]MCY0955769.1 SurA N-terminal domain-containing protein [Streptomyces sp. H27-H5]
MHRRTALSVSAVLLAAAPLLSACSNETRPGTAAVVGGERITTSALQAQVNDVRAAQNRSTTPTPAELVESSPRLERTKLRAMINSRILDRVAEDAGITLTTRELEEQRKQFVDSSGGPQKFQAAILQEAVTAPGQIDRFVTDQLLLSKLMDKYGKDKLTAPASAAAEKLGIEVNPRYGSWDAEGIRLGDGTTPWIIQRTRPEQAVPAGT